MSTMYSIHKTIHPPTGVEASLYCNFIGQGDQQLVVAGSNMLKIYRLVPDPDAVLSSDEEERPKTRLECLLSFSLYGRVAALASASLPGAKRDSLLVAFDEAKLALCEYDPLRHDIATISMHMFEEDEMKSGCTDLTGVQMRVESGDRRIVILPFRREVTVDEETGSRRSPVLPSYVINLKELDERLCNVADVQFLHGYYEPTLAILYEPIKTFAGRLAVRRDTYQLVAISLNVEQRVHPVIWTVANLPFDCLRIAPVPRPIGGALVMATNSLLYLNQSVPTYGVSLNTMTETSSRFPLKTLDSVKMTLDCAHSVFVTPDQLVVSLRTGELYVVTLVADSMRSVRDFNFERAASSVLTTCMTVCDDHYLFLGSRLGNSLLLRIQEKKALDRDGEPLSKRRRTDGPLTNIENLDLEELEVYGSEDMAQTQLKQYTFEVCDSILNLSPCGQLSMGQPAFLSEEFTLDDPDIELITTSGHGKNGALSVLQRSVRPQVVTTFTLPGCLDMWTVLGPDSGGGGGSGEQHAFLLLSRPEATMVLQTGEAINELDKSGFQTAARTVAAGNLGERRYIVQVTTAAVLLLDGSTLVHQVDVGVEAPLAAASIADPYVVVCSESGEVALVSLDDSRLVLTVPDIDTKDVVLASAFVDRSGLFSTAVPSYIRDIDEQLAGVADKQPTDEQRKQELDDEDEIAVRGDVALLSLPDFRPALVLRGLAHGWTVIGHDEPQPQLEGEAARPPPIRELRLSCLGYRKSRPVLTALVGEQLLIYEVFPCYALPESQLKVKLRRVQHDIIIRTRKSKTRPMADAEPGAPGLLREFTNVAGFDGLFLCGPNPHWILMTTRGELRFHPMTIDGRLKSFASFNNVNCPQGFLYFNKEGEMRICVLPPHLLYDAPWPIRKVPLRCTPHIICYHLETKTHLVCTSNAQPSMKVYKFTGDDKELSVEDRGERFPYPYQKVYTIQLYSPVSWEPVPKALMEFEEWEVVTVMNNVSINYEGHRSGQRMYIAVATNHSYGEDVVCRGKLMLLDVIEVVPEPGQPLTKNKLKVLLTKEQSAPVSAISSVAGYLLGAVGQKVFVWTVKNNDLVGVAFIDSQVYIHQLRSMKNFIMAADVCNSVSLLRFQQDFRTISLLARDFKPRDIYAVEYLIDNTQVGFLATDAEANLIVFLYQPESRESGGGQRLMRRADFQLCSRVSTMTRVRCRLKDTSGERKHPPIVAKRHMTVYASLDGGLGFLLPLPEKTYRRLLMLQNLLTSQLPHRLGLNPRSFRTYRSQRRELAPPARGVLDGDLVFSYLSMPTPERHDAARRVGSRPDEIADDLTEVSRYTAHF
ncbi:cleavage and polyadenylation specificity factor subunit 1-like [Pollicipes pollicipes]|uniref:cleavage and polyadenylation specificity factor subunit 1-like n=1 Tax=Pollicipes pollicipes TaxID=41117 RepID=UPI001884D2E4|nr:cleavage and polyadenylation specificity factor subunit 1-like [Pollicipes pollicipes]